MGHPKLKKKALKIMTKAVIKIDPTAVQLAELCAEIILRDYGTHNVEAFRQAINDKLDQA